MTGVSLRSRRLGVVALALLGVLVVAAIAAPVLAPYDPELRTGLPFGAPSGAHLLGTDDVGHDLLSALIHGARISLGVGLLASVVATVIGTVVGLLAGYLRGWSDSVLMRVVDVVLSLPVIPLTIVIGVFAGPGVGTEVLVITMVIWARVARELRAQVLSLREREHILALRAMGAGPAYVLPRHVLPAVAPLLVPQFIVAVRTAVLLEAALAFLGLGDLTAQSWGTMLSVAHERGAFLSEAWLWWVLPPGAAIATTVLAFALLGYALEERTTPTLRTPTPTPTPTPASRDSQHTESVTSAHPFTIDGLTVRYPDADRPAVSGVSLHVDAGELVGLVGESGSGKTTLASAATALLPPSAEITSGRISIGDTALTPASARRLRGDRIALIPQEAMSALNPVRTVGWSITEALRAHRSATGADARIAELLEAVGLEPELAGAYPHQLSGGMRQRVAIAVALANDPAVLIADEPTSGLDVITQAGVLALLDDLRRRLDLAVLVITHDLPMIERVADRIAVMRAGEIVEVGTAGQIVTTPSHPYTRTLVTSAPRLHIPATLPENSEVCSP